MKTALYTTFYPAMLPYLETFWQSVNHQQDLTFDVCIGLDDLSQADVEKHLAKLDVTWVVDEELNGIEIRNRALEQLCQSYDAIILVDSDDILYPDRVSSAKAGLQKHDLYACALDLIDQRAAPLGLSFRAMQQDWQRLVVSVNVFGMSNTAYRSETLAACLPAPRSVVMMDWLIASQAVANGARVYVDDTPRMAYRQYADNTARVLSPYTAAQVLRSAKLVRAHYDLLLTRLDKDAIQPYQQRQAKVRQFLVAMQSPQQLNDYVAKLNTLKPVFLWWECVAHPELESLWQSK